MCMSNAGPLLGGECLFPDALPDAKICARGCGAGESPAPDFILASGSPRRADILRMLGYRFTQRPAHADESLPPRTLPADAVRLLAQRKAASLPDADVPVLGADTVVALGDEILGKPRDEDDARRMLRLLSGRTHAVYTGVCLCAAPGRTETLVRRTDVTFFSLPDALIDRYIASGEPLDKAGGYGIQGKGSVLVERIAGDYFTVVGLPAADTARLLAKAGIFPCWDSPAPRQKKI